MNKFFLLLSATLFLVGCNKSTDSATYSFESFDGRSIKIDESNIIAQQPEDNVLESSLLPDRAVSIAPGRDYAYYEDDNYYFVEDATRSLFTVASKQQDNVSIQKVGDSFFFAYHIDAFAVTENGGSIALSYAKEGVQATGSNTIMFEYVANESCLPYLQTKVSEMAGNSEEVHEIYLSGISETSYCYQVINSAEEGGLSVVKTIYAIPCDGGLVYAEAINTVETDDDATFYAIAADFEFVFQSFVII